MLPRLRECWKATQMAADSLDASLSRPLSQSLDEAIAALDVDSFGNRIATARTQMPGAGPPIGKTTVKQRNAGTAKDAAKRKHKTAA